MNATFAALIEDSARSRPPSADVLTMYRLALNEGRFTADRLELPFWQIVSPYMLIAIR